MNTQLHLVLGGHGAIGQAVIKELQSKDLLVKAVERSKEVKSVETIKADILNLTDIKRAVKGASYVYLCIGIKYKSEIWAEHWPIVMRNVIDACKEENAKLIFLDNVYMYGPSPLTIPFSETHPQKPESKKGKTRKEISNMLLDAFKNGKVKGVIGRAADIYGPYAVNSPFYIVFLENMLKGKSPQSLAIPGVKHTYAYTIDIGRALVALALDESTYGQVWHLPVGQPITIEEVIKIFNKELNSSFTVSFMPRVLLGLMSLFIPPIKEAKEMIYQFDNEYTMSFEKFREHFPEFKPTNYDDGIKEMILSFKESDYKKSNI
jgi:nucleoside-diphosphate-sugar epimerase